MKSKKKMILVLNCGSSSLKYKLIQMPDEKECICGEAQRVGIKTNKKSVIKHVVFEKETVVYKDLPSHVCAFNEIMKLLEKDHLSNPDLKIAAFAHRYVHPGKFFTDTTKVTKRAIKKLEKTLELAPIHNPIAFELIKKCMDAYASVPQYIVFDTTFHKTIPASLATYALPLDVIEKYGIRKMGFHGLSHKYVMQQACRFLDKKETTQRIISCHLGTGGASICAIKNGESINNSMGFTPLEGLIMNTRCGDVDLGLVFYIMFKEQYSIEKINSILNNKSGILGLFEDSSDLRDVIHKTKHEDKAHKTFKMYIKRIKKYIGFYSLLLKKSDILIFTDSIGQESSDVRKKVVQGLEFLGISIDQDKNIKYTEGIKDISSDNSQTKILIVPTNEEIMIAKEAYKEF
ncbi:MAG: acetate/propionate family kinase [Candidatus Omnitrophica bacterium]|nr:acetate/propionate family kinase [Candidatus Omnitrophota bacterium]